MHINGRSWDHDVFRMEGTRKRHRFHDFSPPEEVAVVNSVVPKKTKKANSFWDGVFNSFFFFVVRNS